MPIDVLIVHCADVPACVVTNFEGDTVRYGLANHF